MGRSRYKFADKNLPHFMTCTVLNWIPVFTRKETVEILLNSLHHISKDGMKIYAYVILENHSHLIAQSEDLERDMMRYKSYTARQIIHWLAKNKVSKVLDQLAFYKKEHKEDRTYQFWQEGVHPEWIQNHDMMRQKVEYIHQNPVERGYVEQAEHWRYSSARNYLGLEGLIDVSLLW